MAKLLFVLIVVLAVAWWYFRQRAAREATAARRPGRADRRLSHSTSQFHAVAIKTPVYACEAALKLEGVRFLGSEAPKLPLPECDRDNCECRFQHYDDRRSGRDRRSPFGSPGTTPGTGRFEQERRQADGRRADD